MCGRCAVMRSVFIETGQTGGCPYLVNVTLEREEGVQVGVEKTQYYTFGEDCSSPMGLTVTMTTLGNRRRRTLMHINSRIIS